MRDSLRTVRRTYCLIFEHIFAFYLISGLTAFLCLHLLIRPRGRLQVASGTFDFVIAGRLGNMVCAGFGFINFRNSAHLINSKYRQAITPCLNFVTLEFDAFECPTETVC